jgi:hypothetical protein
VSRRRLVAKYHGAQRNLSKLLLRVNIKYTANFSLAVRQVVTSGNALAKKPHAV